MRRVFARALIAVAAATAVLGVYVIGGRSLSMFVDRIHTVQIENQAVTEFGLEDAAGGMIWINGMPMNTAMPDNRAFPMTIGMDAQGRFAVTINGKSLALGSPADHTESSAGVVIRPEPADHVTFSISRSFISWPTPFDFNFMTGHSPSWKRHLYYRLLWQKPDGANLEMLWRYQRSYYSSDRWASGFMTHEGSTGLLQASVEN